MTSFSLEFDRPDLAGWLWIAFGVLLLVEGVLLMSPSLRGRRGARWTALGLLLTLAAGYVLIRPGRNHLWPLAGLAVAAALYARRAYSRTTRPMTPSRRTALIAIRTAAFLCLLAMLAAPVLQWTHQTRQRSAAVVLLDDSASMAVRDILPLADASSPALARVDAVNSALRRASEAISQAESVVDLHWLQFADQLQAVRWPRLEAKGGSTALLDALAQAQTQFGSLPQRLGAVVVISDGRDNASVHTISATADLFSSAGVPLYAVGVGSDQPTGQTRSLIARRLDCPTAVSMLNAFPIHAEFYAAGLAGTDIEATVSYDDQPVHQETLRPTAAGQVVRLDALHVPPTEGLHRVVVQARASGLEGPAGAAVLSAFVQVINDQTRVAFLDRPRYERAAIARALAGSKDFQVVRMDVLSPGQRPEIDWRPYSAILIGDIDRGTLSDAEIEELRRLVVETGRGFALLGGWRTLGSGQLAGSPLADLSPVDLGASGQLDEQVPLVVTTGGRLHPILQAPAGADPSRFWSALPPLAGASRLTGMKSTAEGLLESPGRQPLLVVQELGRGRSAIVAFDSTWRWSLASDEGADAQKRFWRQLVLWLTNRRPQVWVNVEKPRYLLNRLLSGAERVQIRAGATSGSSAPRPAVRLEGSLSRVTIESRSPASQPRAQTLTWTRTDDVFESRPAIDAPGEYHVQVRAADAAGPIGQAEAAFIVESPDLEWIDPLADPGTLRQLAQATSRQGGAFFPIEQLIDVFDRLTTTSYTTTTQRIERHRLVADHPWGWLALFVALIALEWVVRRRSGLI